MWSSSFHQQPQVWWDFPFLCHLMLSHYHLPSDLLWYVVMANSELPMQLTSKPQDLDVVYYKHWLLTHKSSFCWNSYDWWIQVCIWYTSLLSFFSCTLFDLTSTNQRFTMDKRVVGCTRRNSSKQQTIQDPGNKFNLKLRYLHEIRIILRSHQNQIPMQFTNWMCVEWAQLFATRAIPLLCG